MVEKVKCTNCGAMILPATAEKYVGLCAQCGSKNYNHRLEYLTKSTPIARKITEFVALTCTTTARNRLEQILKEHSIIEPHRNNFTLEFLAILSLFPYSDGWRAITSTPELSRKSLDIINDQCRGILSFLGAVDNLRSQNSSLLSDDDLLNIIDNNDLCFYLGDAFDWAKPRYKGKGVVISSRDLLLSFLDAEIPHWITKPTKLASTIQAGKEFELVRYVDNWSDNNSEIRIVHSLIVEIRKQEGQYTASLLTPKGTFNQFEYDLQSNDVSSALFSPCKPPLFLQSELKEFESLVNESPQVRESRIQHFLETKSHFLRLLGGQRFAPQVHLVRQNIDGNHYKRINLYPDFILEDIGLPKYSIVELKRAQERMSSGPEDRSTWSARLNYALSQLEDYYNFFEDSQNRKWFNEKYGVDIIKPELTIIIGNSGMRTNIFGKTLLTPIDNRPVRILNYDYIMSIVRAQHLIFPDSLEPFEIG